MSIGQITQKIFTNPAVSFPLQSSELSIGYKNSCENDCFEFSNPIEHNAAKKIFSKVKKFSVHDYEKLNGSEISALRSVCGKNAKVCDAAQKSLDMALLLKPYLDEKYGEDKYVFVSVGRSPAGIARAFEFMGVETKYLPISNLRCYPDSDCVIGGAEGLDKYGNFLKKQGINNDNIKQSGKHFLFFDYTYTGKSLNFFNDLIRKYYKINLKNMHFLSINNLLAEAAKDDKVQGREVSGYITRYMIRSGIEPFGGVSELKVSSLNEINRCKNFSSPQAKMFNFMLMDSLNQSGLLKENKKNKKSL